MLIRAMPVIPEDEIFSGAVLRRSLKKVGYHGYNLIIYGLLEAVSE